MPSKFLIANCHPGPPEQPIFSLSRQDIWVAFGLAVMVLVLGAWQMVLGVCGVYHDDAIYVITGKALAQGYGYRLINLPGSPFQTKYPILYPALLSVIWKIWPAFPENLLAMQWLSLLAGRARWRLPTFTWSASVTPPAKSRWFLVCFAPPQHIFFILAPSLFPRPLTA